MLKQSIIGVDAATGEILWRALYSDYQSSPHGINPNSPVYHDGSFYTTSGYECGGALHQLSPHGDGITRKWIDKVLDCHHGGVVLVDGYLYGSNFKGHYAGDWVCLEWATNYSAQSTTNLATTAQWWPIMNLPHLVGSLLRVDVALTKTPAQCFRLQCP